MKKAIIGLMVSLALLIVPSFAATGHINGCTNTGEWNNCCTKTFNITPKAGYRIVDVIVNGVSKGAITSYTFGDLSSAQILKVITEAIQEELCTITATVEGSGTITPSGAVTVAKDSNKTFNIAPNTGYVLSELKIDGNAVTTTSSYTFENVTSNHTIAAKFSPIAQIYTILVTQGENGTITPATASVPQGGSYTFTITPNVGYKIASILVDGVSQPITNRDGMQFLMSNVTASHTLTATYEYVPWNSPALATGLTPVNWNGTEWEETTEGAWDYNYNSVTTYNATTVVGNGSGKWANAMTDDGSLYVWIPRYSYKITAGEHAANQKSWNSADASGDAKVEIKWSNGTIDDLTDGYTNHYAFTFGTDELAGLWVAKYEASRNDATKSSAGTGTTPASKPGVMSWRTSKIGDMFNYAYNVNRDLESHMMKNGEWGAVAYLTSAIGRTPYINNNSSFITGMAGDTQNASESSSTNAWNTVKGVKASTTHNVYGIYDMAGGAWDYVAGYVENNNDSLMAYGASMVNSLDKYKDVYLTGTYDNSNYNYTAMLNRKGDAVYETSSSYSGKTSWDSDTSIMPAGGTPFFARGGKTANASEAGIFSFSTTDGANGSSVGAFRIVLVPEVVSTPNTSTNTIAITQGENGSIVPTTGYGTGGDTVTATCTYVTDSVYTVSGGSTPWIVSGNEFRSNNVGVRNSSSNSIIQLSGTGRLSFNYRVSSIENSSTQKHSRLSIWVTDNLNGTQKIADGIAGTFSGTYNKMVNGNITILLNYEKDNNSSYGVDDLGAISNLKFIGKLAEPESTVTVKENESTAVYIAPKAGYQIATVTVDGVNQSITNKLGMKYRFKDVTENHTVSATYTPRTYTWNKYTVSMTEQTYVAGSKQEYDGGVEFDNGKSSVYISTSYTITTDGAFKLNSPQYVSSPSSTDYSYQGKGYYFLPNLESTGNVGDKMYSLDRITPYYVASDGYYETDIRYTFSWDNQGTIQSTDLGEYSQAQYVGGIWSYDSSYGSGETRYTLVN